MEHIESMLERHKDRIVSVEHEQAKSSIKQAVGSPQPSQNLHSEAQMKAINEKIMRMDEQLRHHGQTVQDFMLNFDPSGKYSVLKVRNGINASYPPPSSTKDVAKL